MDMPAAKSAEHAHRHPTPIWFRLSTRLQFGLGVVLAGLGGATVGALLGLAIGSAVLAMAAATGLVAVVAVCIAVPATLRSSREDAMPPAAVLDELGLPEPDVSLDPAAAETQPMLPTSAPTSFDAPADIRDSLTGAFTQRYFIAAADREWSRIRRHGEDAALLMIDADQLRVINETHGQACGDAVLVHLTRLVNATLRQYDLMARFNAGVLVVYLPHTDPIGAIDVAERIRERIANFRMAWPTGAVAVTVSVGVASIGADHSALDTVISDAGAALREAKAAGRNCVRAAPVPPKRNPANGVSQGDRRIRGSN